MLVMEAPQKRKIELPLDLATPFLGICPKNVLQDMIVTCTPMFTAALFTIARLWKQPTCPITDAWVKKMWYIYAMEFYSVIKNIEIMLIKIMQVNGWNSRSSVK
jgi:hypothetical protein